MDLASSTPMAARLSTIAIAIAASAMLHALGLTALAILVWSHQARTPVVIFPVSLVFRPGAGNGPGGGEPTAVPAPPPPPETAETKPPPEPAPVAARARAEVVARPRPVKPKPSPNEAGPAPPVTASAASPAKEGTTASGTAASGGGPGGGAGTGLGSGVAGPAYGVNPEPPYPLAARRMGLEGTVLLRILVASDGSPKSVEVLRSSGHEVLDASALETVRTKWRFVPARHNGIPVDDAVQVPITFRQTAG